jgi:hypothetical protein
MTVLAVGCNSCDRSDSFGLVLVKPAKRVSDEQITRCTETIQSGVRAAALKMFRFTVTIGPAARLSDNRALIERRSRALPHFVWTRLLTLVRKGEFEWA